MLPAVRLTVLGFSSMVRGLLPAVTTAAAAHRLHLVPARRQGWWTPPGGGDLPPGLRSRWVSDDTYELTVDMGRGEGGIKYDTNIRPNGDVHVTARWGDGQVAHMKYSLPPGVDPSSVQTTLGEDGVVKITARLKKYRV